MGNLFPEELPHLNIVGLVLGSYFKKRAIAIVSDLLDWALSQSLMGSQRGIAHAPVPSPAI